jgi:hypothetical protein
MLDRATLTMEMSSVTRKNPSEAIVMTTRERGASRTAVEACDPSDVVVVVDGLGLDRRDLFRVGRLAGTGAGPG